MDIKIERY